MFGLLLRKVINFVKENRFSKWVLKTKRRKIALLVLIILAFFWQISSARKPDWEVNVSTVQREKLIETVSASGEVKAENYAELSFLSSENIKEILVADAAEVKKGDLIARLDATSVYQSYLQAEADLRAKQSTLDRVYDEVKGHEGDETFEQKEDRTAAEAAKDRAYRAFVIAQKNLANTNLRAPFDGIVNFKDGASIGTYSSPATSSFVIVDPQTVYFESEVNELDVPGIVPGAKVKIELDAYPDEVYEERVHSVGFVSTTTSTGGSAYKVRVSLPDNLDNKFRIGMNGDADFILSEQDDALIVPISSVSEEDGKSFVWLVAGGNRVRKQVVETGATSIDDYEILSGVNEGDRIVERPPANIKEKDKIGIKGK